jgi:DNA polymerase/3'-5' exonuclease PolX
MKIYELLFLLNKKKLQNFKTIQNKTSIPFINKAYDNVIIKVKEGSLNNQINKQEISKLDITDKMKEKLKYILNKKISNSDKKNAQKMHLHEQLTQIAGIGKHKANELIIDGLTDIKQLSQKQWQLKLPSSVIFWINHKPIQKIPYECIKQIKPQLTLGFIKSNFKKHKLSKIKIVGGYLRKKPYSKDIDVMCISNKPILNEYISYLKSVFYSVVYNKGPNKASIILQIPKSKGSYYKIDIFVSLPKYQYAMLLYSTGSKKFNIHMRCIAKKKGYLLNQKGLYILPYKSGQSPIKITSEKDIFKKLGMCYVLPINR